MLHGIAQTFADGDIIFSQSDVAADMYVITSGKVHIFRTKDGYELTLAVLGPGEFFGEMGLFSPGPRSASARALGELEVEAIDRAGFIASVPEPVVWDMLAKMSERVRRLNETIEAIAEGVGPVFT
jgi:CRP-like cAMP-binding protein